MRTTLKMHFRPENNGHGTMIDWASDEYPCTYTVSGTLITGTFEGADGQKWTFRCLVGDTMAEVRPTGKRF